MKKILILGHTGFVGKELSKRFKDKKIIFDCYSKKQIIYEGKIQKKTDQFLKKLIFKNDIIINCVGENTDLKYMYSRNYNFVKKILNFIEKSKKKKYLIHLSSCAVYGKYFHFNKYIIDENTDPFPISKYAKSKLKGDKVIIKNQIPYLKYSIIRPSQVVGLNMNALGFINLAKFIKKRLFVYVSSKSAVRNYVNSEDLTFLIYKLCSTNKIKNNIYIISRYSKLRIIIKLIEKKLRIKNYIEITIPKFLLIYIVTIIRFFFKGFPVNKEIVEGLSITAKIKSNIYRDFKSFKLKNIDNYLKKISR